MDIQASFNKLVNLLEQKRQDNELVSELLNYCQFSEIVYSSSDIKDAPNTKEHLLAIYETREKIQKGRELPFVIGYDRLLPSLRKTEYRYLCISGIIEKIGTYTIFTDYDKADLIGLLKSLPYLPGSTAFIKIQNHSEI